jgi:RimJ/RimL family protein N-acetyltransferase
VALRLEPFSEAHLPAFAELLDDPDVQRFTRVPEPPPPDFARTWLGIYEERRSAGTGEAFALLDADGAFLGTAVAPSIKRREGTAELGYVVAPAARGRGVATDALRQATAWAFAEGMIRLELLISVDNPASKKVAERCGYVYEGTLRSLYVKEDVRGDTEIWSRLASD